MFRTRVLAIFLLLACYSQAYSNSPVEGVYQSISESEWEITLSLFSSGDAEIKLENWDAGEYDKRNVKVVIGKWSIKESKILLKYEGITDVLKYTDKLSLDEFGRSGSAPGLVQISPIESKSIINGIKLWKKPLGFLNDVER